MEIFEDHNGIYKIYNLTKLRSNYNNENNQDNLENNKDIQKQSDYTTFSLRRQECNNMDCSNERYDHEYHYCSNECIIDGEYNYSYPTKTVIEYVNDNIHCDGRGCLFIFVIAHTQKYYEKLVNELIEYKQCVDIFEKILEKYNEHKIYYNFNIDFSQYIKILEQELLVTSEEEQIEINKVVDYLKGL